MGWDEPGIKQSKANAPPAIKLAILSGEKAKLAAFKTLTTPEFLHLFFQSRCIWDDKIDALRSEKLGQTVLSICPASSVGRAWDS